MPSSPEAVDLASEEFTTPPDPGQAGTLDELVERLRLLKVWAGDPSFERIKDRINATWTATGRPAAELARKTTVVSCFRPGRRRVNTDLFLAVVQALHPDTGYAAQWRQALRVIGGEVEAAAQVRVQDSLPPDLADFTGRTLELDQLRQALHRAQQGGEAVVVSAIEGMAGVGKTELAVRAGHLLTRDRPLDRVLFVNLRGFHPDPKQPPADPAAVLDGFLRLLGVPGQQIPYDLAARTAAYRQRLAGTQTLIVLDNAADTAQVRPLLADTPGCLTLVTSRRSLADLQPATRLKVDVFTPDEAIAFLGRAVPEVVAGTDPLAAARIAARCGYLPLALSLVAGHIRSTPGWTLTDHADRLDERHHQRHLDTGVQLALNVSYQYLPADRQRLLRLAALHPGQDFDAYAAAAMAGTDLPTAQDQLHHLYRDHLLQQGTPGRYSFHDLVRAYAADLSVDQDRPPQRHAALTGLFDFYRATAATAMDVAHPHERHRRPEVPPVATPTPDLSDRQLADHWLDTELANLLAAAHHATQHGWHEHIWQLSMILDLHLRIRGRHGDAQTLHQQALHLARHRGNRPAEMNALNYLGYIHRVLCRYEQASDYYGRALQVAQAIGSPAGERHALTGLGDVHGMQGRYEQSGDHFERALRIARAIGDRPGELHALNGLGDVHGMLSHHEQAGDHFGQALQIAQAIGDRVGERNALAGLGDVHRILGRYEQAGDYYRQALRVAQESGNRIGERNALAGLGYTHRMLGRYEQSGDHYGRALQIAQEIGDRVGELNALVGLGYIQRMLGRYEQAGDHYDQALRIAQSIGYRAGEQNALNGLGHVHRMLNRPSEAANCYQQLLDLAREVGHRNWQFEALQGLGRLSHATGHAELALTHHQQALQHATELAQPTDQARAHDGLAHAHHTLRHHEQARRHWQHALDILSGLGTDHTEEPEASAANMRANVSNLDKLRPTADLSR